MNRVNSNTPLQALVLLNDPTFVEAARVFAEKTLRNGGPSLDARIDWAFMQALDRKPTAAERRVLANLHATSLAEFQTKRQSAQDLIHIGDAPVEKDLKPTELAAMTVLTRAILNLHETITRN